MPSIKNVMIMLALAGFAFVSLFLAILTLVVFEQETFSRAIFFSFCIWSAIYVMVRIGRRLYGKMERGYENSVSTDNGGNSSVPKENPYEDYQPMIDPERELAANPPVDWLQKRDFQQIKLADIEHEGVKYEVVMLINRKKGVMAITLNGQPCKVTTRLAHTDSCNSGDRKYTCLRPESTVILPGKILELSDEDLANPGKMPGMPDEKLPLAGIIYNEYCECWEMSWHQMKSCEIYNTVVYDHYDCYLSLKPAELKAEFTIFTNVDSTT
ncbi:MAG: hypothetical protein BWY02_02793 [bacterium ADurb.Bin157]|nr:MAG: hypothetical protein BWY02_02793 [bacterium ADurb.Bin157]